MLYVSFCKRFGRKSLVDLPKRDIGRTPVFLPLSPQHDTAQPQGIRTNQHELSYLEEELVSGVSAFDCGHI